MPNQARKPKLVAQLRLFQSPIHLSTLDPKWRTTAVELLAQLLLKATGFSLADEGEEGKRDEAL